MITIYSRSHNHPLKVSYQLHLCNCQLTLCVHPSKHASLSLCVRVCVCEMCLHASVHNIMCSAQPEVAAVTGTALKQIQHIGKGGGRKWQGSR